MAALNPISEKKMYSSILDEIAYKYDVEGFIWGEEMYDCKVHVYPYKLSDIPEYTEVYDDLINVGLVHLNRKKANLVQIINIRLNEVTGTDIYIPEDQLNCCWKYLRTSVCLGMQLCKENGIEADINKPEDILDLRLLERNGKHPYLDERTWEVRYLKHELSDSEIEEQKRKHRALDNPNNRYFFDRNQSFYHDRTCEGIKEIAPKDFMASETIPQGYLPCEKCLRMILLRKGCDPYVKQIPDVDAFLRQAEIDNEILKKYVMDREFGLHLNQDGNLVAKCAEDTWLIKRVDSGKYSLWHNNYVKTAPRERYITSGFHDQKVIRRKLTDLFDYIAGYTFDVHLAAEDRKIKMAAQMERARRNPLYRLIWHLKKRIASGFRKTGSAAKSHRRSQ